MIVSTDTKKTLTKNRAHPIIGKKPILAALLVGLVALAVYLRTLASGIVFGDGSELTTAAYLGGVAHPTGYPFYTILGYLFTHCFPIGTIIYRMNLLSALFGAAAVTVLYLLALRVTRSRVPSAVLTLLMAFSVTFWSQAVIAEVYAAHLFFVVLTLLCVVSWDAEGNRRWLLSGAFIWGLSFTHHMTTALLTPGLLYFVLTSPYRRQFLSELRWTVPLFLAPFLLYLYLPLISLHDSAWTFADIRSVNAFHNHVAARIYQYRMGVHSWAVLWQHIVEYGGPLVHDDRPGHHDNPAYLLSQFSISLLWLAPWGAYGLFRRRRRIFGLTLLVYLAGVVWALNYDIPDIDVYYIPSHMIVALWIGCGLRQLSVCLARFWRRIAVPMGSRRRLVMLFGTMILGLPLILLAMNWQANDMRHNRSAQTLGTAVLDVLKPNAVLICDDDVWVFPELYLRYVERKRPDVIILPVFLLETDTNIRLFRRLGSHGLIVHVPKDYSEKWFESARWKLLASIIRDNRSNRPIYLAGPVIDQLSKIAPIGLSIPALVPVGPGQPVFEVRDREGNLADRPNPEPTRGYAALKKNFPATIRKATH